MLLEYPALAKDIRRFPSSLRLATGFHKEVDDVVFLNRSARGRQRVFARGEIRFRAPKEERRLMAIPKFTVLFGVKEGQYFSHLCPFVECGARSSETVRVCAVSDFMNHGSTQNKEHMYFVEL